jgi:hypothetical protein
MRNIKDVVVNRISLVSKNHRPAVKKAETRFSIFKIKKTNKKHISKIESLQNDLNNILKKEKLNKMLSELKDIEKNYK